MSELLAGTVDGAPLTDEQLLSYCELFVEAGNETTRNAISGGLLAFCEHPDEWEKLRANPELLPDRGRGDPALGQPDQSLHARRDRGLRDPRRRDPRRRSARALLRVGEPRRGGVRRSVRRSASTAIRTRTSRSASVSTSASVRTSRASRSRPSSGTCSRGSSRSSWPGTVERLKSAVNGSIKQLPLRYRLV